MARLSLTVQAPAGFWPVLPLTAGAEDFTFTNAGASFADGFSFTNTGREILIFKGGAGGETITISSVAMGDTKRSGDITAYAIGAGLYVWLGPFKPSGWNQVGTSLLFGAASATDVGIVVCRLPILN